MVTLPGLRIRTTFYPDQILAVVLPIFTIIENEMLNGEVIRLDGAIRLAPK